jgi:predicted transcriptional regulator
MSKSAQMPAIRVDPDLRQAAESVLADGESLSSLIEQSVRGEVERRQAQRAFISRGIASAERARQAGTYHAAEDVHRELEAMLLEAEAAARAKPGA